MVTRVIRGGRGGDGRGWEGRNRAKPGNQLVLYNNDTVSIQYLSIIQMVIFRVDLL